MSALEVGLFGGPFWQRRKLRLRERKRVVRCYTVRRRWGRGSGLLPRLHGLTSLPLEGHSPVGRPTPPCPRGRCFHGVIASCQKSSVVVGGFITLLFIRGNGGSECQNQFPRWQSSSSAAETGLELRSWWAVCALPSPAGKWPPGPEAGGGERGTRCVCRLEGGPQTLGHGGP